MYTKVFRNKEPQCLQFTFKWFTRNTYIHIQIKQIWQNVKFSNLGRGHTCSLYYSNYCICFKFFKIKISYELNELGSHIPTHIYCLEQHKLASVQGKICPFAQSLFLFEGQAHTLGRGTNTSRKRVKSKNSRQYFFCNGELPLGFSYSSR